MTEGKRYFSFPQIVVIILGLVTLALGLGNLGRAAMASRYAARLPDLPMTVSWTYLAAMGGFWGAILMVCAVGLLGFRPWSRWLTPAAVTFYQAHIWVNHLRFDASDYARQTWPRDLLLTLILLTLFWGSLNLRVVRKAFEGETEDNSANGEAV